MNKFKRMTNDTICILKQNGDIVENVKASVQKNKIFIFRSDVLIEIGDHVRRKMSNGSEETFRVIDPGFYEKVGNIDAHYQMDVQNVGINEVKNTIQHKNLESKKITDLTLEEIDQEIDRIAGFEASGGGYGSPDARFADERRLKTLISLREQKMNTSSPKPSVDVNRVLNEVFIVHGHDDGATNQVARFIEKIGLVAIILHEQASESRTIIEKIEKYSDVAFGIILYTPCDFGKAKLDKDLRPRARQNVVFEHGYLIGKIGRSRVCALVKGDIEVPNDISGVVYIKLDKDGAWKYKVAKEIKSAGYAVDLNKLM
ncbi:MAG: nucleotide-binding protein [Deltaproteobacteria bacterium]|nr:nucleotide-binding protein [Deltaproteobacteria bacterium]